MKLKHLERGAPRRQTVRRIALVAATLLPMSLLPMPGAQSASGLTSDEVATEILRVQNQADQTAERWAEAQRRSEELATEIVAAEGRVAEASAQQVALDRQMASIAVHRFTGAGAGAAPFFASDPALVLQRDVLRGVALDTGAADIDAVDAVRADLVAERARLDRLVAENEQVVAVLEGSREQLDEQLIELAKLRDRLKDEEVRRAYEAKLAAQRAAAEKAAAQKAAAEQAAAAAAAVAAAAQPRAVSVSAAQATPRGGGAATPATTASPAPARPPAGPRIIGSGSWICPVQGPNAFGDTWGAARSGGRRHQGVDMMSPRGTPLVAVVGGTVLFKTNRLGGNAVWLTGADGNKYYYAHLSAWEGSSRGVSAGEVIGYVGATGNTSANHLHFEIHPGGGAAINPYPTVRAHC